MSTTAEALQSYRARTEATEDYLGRVAILSQRDATIRHDDLERILTDHGLKDFMPGMPADIDVFRRVTAKDKIQRSKEPVSDDVVMNVLIRDIVKDDNELVKRIVCELVDADKRQLFYDGVIDLVYDRQAGRMYKRTTLGFAGVIPGLAETIANDALTAYHANRGRVDDAALRYIATRVISASHGIKLRSTGSVYFVTKAHTEKLEALSKAAKLLPGMQVDTIRLVDEGDGDQRDMIHNAADADIAAEASRLAAELRELAAAGTIGERRATTLLKEFRRLQERATAHETLLEQTLDESRIKLSQLQFAIQTAVAKVEL